MPLTVYTYRATVPGSDLPIDLCLFFNHPGDLHSVAVFMQFRDEPMKMLTVDADWFFVLFGEVAKDAYEAAVS